jgi:uncharacterized protein YqfA (UPF0365 family)
MKMNNFLIQQTARAVGRFMTALAAGVTTGILVLAGSALLREASAQIKTAKPPLDSPHGKLEAHPYANVPRYTLIVTRSRF